MQAAFKTALVDAVSFLKELPRGRDDEATAYSRLEIFRQEHLGVRADLFTDQPPGSPRLDYDLMLGLPDGSTLALSWRADAGLPWVVEYADHPAANFVVTVNGGHTSIQQALAFLKLSADRHPDLMTELVDQNLIGQAIVEDPPPVSTLEILAAVNEFRWMNGLQSTEAINRWLQQTGLSVSRFEALVSHSIQRQKLERRLTDDRLEPYFQTHQKEFEIVQFVLVETSNQETAHRLAAAAADQSLLVAAGVLSVDDGDTELQASMKSQHASELRAELVAVSPGVLVGPIVEGSRCWVAQVLKRYPARLDEKTRAAIRKLLVLQWLMERREQASVRWHWL